MRFFPVLHQPEQVLLRGGVDWQRLFDPDGAYTSAATAHPAARHFAHQSAGSHEEERNPIRYVPVLYPAFEIFYKILKLNYNRLTIFWSMISHSH